MAARAPAGKSLERDPNNVMNDPLSKGIERIGKAGALQLPIEGEMIWHDTILFSPIARPGPKRPI